MWKNHFCLFWAPKSLLPVLAGGHVGHWRRGDEARFRKIDSKQCKFFVFLLIYALSWPQNVKKRPRRHRWPLGVCNINVFIVKLMFYHSTLTQKTESNIAASITSCCLLFSHFFFDILSTYNRHKRSDMSISKSLINPSPSEGFSYIQCIAFNISQKLHYVLLFEIAF